MTTNLAESIIDSTEFLLLLYKEEIWKNQNQF
jgi:hypothetical protein